MDNSMLGKAARILVTAPADMLGTLADLLEKVAYGDPQWFVELKRFLRKEPCWVSKSHSDIFYLPPVKSDGRDTTSLLRDLESKGFRKSREAIEISNEISNDISRGLSVVVDGLVYKPVVVRGTHWLVDDERTIKNIRKFADEQGFITPSLELAFLLREVISDVDIRKFGLWCLVVMHDSVTISDNSSNLLSLDCGNGGKWLNACYGTPEEILSHDDGFVFLSPQ